MKIVLLGPAYPYRGGLASILHTMAREYHKMGHEVSIVTFTVQYPSILFPGKTQYSDGKAPEDLKITREVNTCNPFNWIKVGRQLKKMAPDVIILKYWTPFMAPCFGTILRIARLNKKTRVVCQIDNVQPHEHHFIDRPFNKYFLTSVDGFVYMSEQVHGELQEYTSVPQIFSPHPMFENFGERVSRESACSHLDIDSNYKYILFFGLIREYKGLDILLEAMQSDMIPDDVRLIVAGEYYEDKSRYEELYKKLGERVVLHDHFISDEDVKYYFSVSDAVVLPYRTATQSGVTQIAYNFSTPMIVTNVGGLPEIVAHGKVGFVVNPSKESVSEAISELYKNSALDHFAASFPEERKKFSWETMCEKLLEVVNF